MLSAPAATCANHRRRERVATCGVCNSALCIDCVVHTAVGVKCRKCTGAAATAPTAAAKARAPRAGAAGGAKRRWPVPVAVAGAVLMLVAAFAVINRGGGKTDNTAAVPGGGATVEDHMHDGGAAGAANTSFTDKKADFVGGGGLKIGATLTVPNSLGTARSAPGVLIVPGGGAQDRNGGVDIVSNLPDPLYQDLAESFAQAGMVALRYDKRGTGESQLGQGVPLTWDGLVADAKAGLSFLSERRETQGRPLTVVGYDQGGFVAMKLAESEASVKGLVLISTPGRTIPDVLANDFLRGVPDPAKAQVVSDAVKSAAASLVATGVAPVPADLPEELKPIFSADVPYLKGLFSFDPVAEAKTVHVPTLLVRGGNDGSILPRDVAALRGSLAKSDELISTLGSNTITLPQGQEGRWHNPARHGTTRDGDALLAIDDWIAKNVK